MINKKILFAVLVASSVLVATPTASFAQGSCERSNGSGDMSYMKGEHKKGGHKGGKYSGMRMERMAKKLGLSEEQKTQITEIKASSSAAKSDLREQMIENRQALKALDTTSADYEANVEAIAATIAGLEKEKIIARAKVKQQINAVLTDEQKEQLESMKDRKGKKCKRHGKSKG